MKKMTKTEKLIEIVKRMGYKEINSKSSKYRTFEKLGDEDKYFIGKNGGIRSGKNSSNSYSMTMFFERRIQIFDKTREKEKEKTKENMKKTLG